jgi:folylpolyglutamate synthase/dihydropteroate synthase
LEAKHYDEMAALLAPEADAIIVTSPQVLAKTSARVADLAAAVRHAGFSGTLEAEPDPTTAMERGLELARNLPNALLLVSGSLYLVGNVRGRWYPDDAVTLARTPWPDPAAWPRHWFAAPST